MGRPIFSRSDCVGRPQRVNLRITEGKLIDLIRRQKMNHHVLSAIAIIWLTLCAVVSPVHAGLLNRADVDKLLDSQYVVGEVQADMPVYPLFEKNSSTATSKPELKGYAFESIDFEPVRGYSGKPIDVLVAIDMTGTFLDLRLVDHKEPFFNNVTGTGKLTNFAAQYIDLSLQHTIRVHDHTFTTRRDEQSADLQGVHHGTVTAKAMDRSIIVSASMVAVDKLSSTGAGNAASAASRRTSKENYKPLSWDEMLSRRMVGVMTLTRGELDRAYAGTRSAGADKLASTKPDEPALIFHTALISTPSIGRNLLDSEGWRYLNTSRRVAKALLVTESGPMSQVNDPALRVSDALPFVLKQNGQTLKLTRLAYDKELKVPGYPKNTKAYFLIVDKATPLDPEQSFDLLFTLGRQFGTNQVLNRAEKREFPLPHHFYGLRAKAVSLFDTDWSAEEWVKVWQGRWIEISFLLVGLLILSISLIAQKRTSATSQRLKILRTAYLLFTLGFIGWYAQGQLTIINITAAVESLRSGGDLGFLLNDPMTTLLWIFVGGTLLVWGRSTFCGWLCPFGALQELISMLTNAIGVRQRRLRSALDAKLKWIKYGVLIFILGSLFVAPSMAEIAVKIEPFETAISFYFMREWPYLLWALLCLGLGVVVYRGYCRYICPLGAALAAVNFLQRWSWIARRDACGTPCQSCRHRCEYQAISPAGKINYSECFQCLDCVSIYQDDQRCLPLIEARKGSQRIISIQSVQRS